MNIKIIGITTTYNVSEKIPYVMPYYERMGIDKLVVFDNYSTDNTIELLSKYPFVEIRYFDTNGLYCLDTILSIKNNAWKEFKEDYDWCVVSDFDEVLYSRRNFKEVLIEKTKEGKTYLDKIALNLVSREFPPINDKLLHEKVDCGVLWDMDDYLGLDERGIPIRCKHGIYGNKVLLFNIKNCDIEYIDIGCHDCIIPKEQNKPFDDDISFFHIKFIDINYLIKNSNEYNSRLENSDRYECLIDNFGTIYNILEKNAVDIDYYIDTRGDLLYPIQLQIINHIENTEEGVYVIDEMVKHYYSENNKYQYIGILLYFNAKNANNQVDIDYLFKYAGNYVIILSLYCYHDDNIYSINNNINQDLSSYDKYLRYGKMKKNIWVINNNVSLINNEKLFEEFNRNKLNDHFIFDDVEINRFSRFTEIPRSTLGCYLIVKNEEKNIEKCLNNLSRICDEIVVVDTGSVDDTIIKIVGHFEKVRLYSFKWINDFSAARNYAMSLTKSDYIFTIDADEELTDELIDTLNELRYGNFNGLNSIGLFKHEGDMFFNYGSRQIIKNHGYHEWKYKVHEKLYYNNKNEYVINKENGYINHNSDNPEGNFNKYSELYYNELNDRTVLSDLKTHHYYYYLYFTLRNIDLIMAKKYLYNCFDEDRWNSVEIFNHPVNLVHSGFISDDDFIINTLINAYKSPQILMDYISKDGIDDITKYCALSYLYENGYDLNESQLIDLSYKMYNIGLFNDFVKITKESLVKYPESYEINCNNNYINGVLSKLNDYKLVIDCKNGITHLPSIINYTSQYFKDLYLINVDEKELNLISFDPFEKVMIISEENNDNSLRLDGNTQYNRDIIRNKIEEILMN